MVISTMFTRNAYNARRWVAHRTTEPPQALVTCDKACAMYKEWRQGSRFLFPPPIFPSHRAFDFVGGQTLLGLNPMASPPTLRPQGHQSRPSMFRKSRPQESHPALTCQPTSYVPTPTHTIATVVGLISFCEWYPGGYSSANDAASDLTPEAGKRALLCGRRVGRSQIAASITPVRRVRYVVDDTLDSFFIGAVAHTRDFRRSDAHPLFFCSICDATIAACRDGLTFITGRPTQCRFATLARCPDVALPQSHSGRCREARSDSATKQTDEFIPPPLAGGSFWVVRRMNPGSEYEMRRSASGWQWRAHLHMLFGHFARIRGWLVNRLRVLVALSYFCVNLNGACRSGGIGQRRHTNGMASEDFWTKTTILLRLRQQNDTDTDKCTIALLCSAVFADRLCSVHSGSYYYACRTSRYGVLNLFGFLSSFPFPCSRRTCGPSSPDFPALLYLALAASVYVCSAPGPLLRMRRQSRSTVLTSFSSHSEDLHLFKVMYPTPAAMPLVCLVLSPLPHTSSATPSAPPALFLAQLEQAKKASAYADALLAFLRFPVPFPSLPFRLLSIVLGRNFGLSAPTYYRKSSQVKSSSSSTSLRRVQIGDYIAGDRSSFISFLAGRCFFRLLLLIPTILGTRVAGSLFNSCASAAQLIGSKTNIGYARRHFMLLELSHAGVGVGAVAVAPLPLVNH
ncbi:hypothetical protein DFH08DRAFT_824557 [Mycena albidolilacea]|uniref:Uncharacterized protein n=1 Tax=Mycena albidolilacea TaxID=1033008 RepID=A0AAD6Z4J5_9AGAR|nr:hypothetical protein DFH08DRAFT_824557 [Mycena albidolilacea]